jgi:hypothetical protein
VLVGVENRFLGAGTSCEGQTCQENQNDANGLHYVILWRG